MRVQFAGLVDDVSNSLEKRNVTTDRAVLFLQNVHPLLKSRIDDMTKASSIQKVLTIVTSQACSWFDYEIIKDLVGKLGDDHDRKLVSEYEAKFEEFAERRKLPKGKKHIEVGSGARKGGKQLVIKIDKEWNEVNFSDIDKIRDNLASILNVKRRDLYLADVREGCVMMTFMITEELAGTLFPKKNDLTSSKLSSYFSSSQLKLLQDESIILLTCGKVSWRWRPAMDQSLPEPQEKSLVYSKPLDSHPDSLLDRQKLESQSPILGSPKEANDTEQSTVVTVEFVTDADSVMQLFPMALVSDNDDLKQAGSFSKMHTFGTGQQVPGAGAALPGRRSWISSNEIHPPVPLSGSQLSQDSVFNSLTCILLTPLPPRPKESDSNVLKMLCDEMKSMNFARAEPEDYLEPLASKRLTSTSLERVPKRDKLSPNIDNLPQSLTDHFGNANNSSSSSIETVPGEVFDNSQLPPDAHNNSSSIDNISSVNSGAVGGVVEPGGDPTRDRDTLSQTSSPANIPMFTHELVAGICDCIQSVSDHFLSKQIISDSTLERMLTSRGISKEQARILVLSAQSSVSSNTLSIYHYPRRCHSLISMNEEGERRSLSSYLQDLENKVTRLNSYTCNLPPNSGSLNQLKNSNKYAAAIANEQIRVAVQTVAVRQTELVQADLNMSRRPMARKMAADSHPLPLLKHNTISSSLVSSSTMNIVTVASTKSPSASSVFSPVMNNAPPLKVDGTMGGAPPVPPGNLVSPGDEAQLPPQPLPLASRMQQPPLSSLQKESLFVSNQHQITPGAGFGLGLGNWKTTDCTMPPSAGGMAPGVGGPPPGAAFHNQNHIHSQTTHHLNRNGDSR